MNFDDFVTPIGDFLEWSFGFLELGGNNANYTLMAFIAIALVYWTMKLIGYEKSEVANRQ